MTRDRRIDMFERGGRTGNLLRSVLPRDLFQLLFVTGMVCFCIAPQLEWGPVFQQGSLASFAVIPLFVPYVFSFTAAAGCLLFFRPGREPIASLLWWVCVPALTGLFAVCAFFMQHAIGPRAAIDGASMHDVMSTLVFNAKQGTGFHWALGGIVLAAVFTQRVWRGNSSLPLTLKASNVSPYPTLTWPRLHTVLWILLSGVWKILFWFVGIVVFFALVRSPRFLRHEWLFYVIEYSLVLICFVGLAAWTDGRGAVAALLRTLRLPVPESFLLAIALSFGAVLFGSFVFYTLDLLRWAIESSSAYPLPHLAALLSVPHPERIASLLPAAFLEEVIFRAFLLRQFVIRYGILRGLVLVSIVFAAWHCGSDFSRLMNDGEVVSHLCIRSVELVAIGLMLGWLALRTGSILPSVLAHALGNAFSGTSMSGSSESLWSPLQAVCISISIGSLAYVLLRYWPIQEDFHANTQPLPLHGKQEQKISQ